MTDPFKLHLPVDATYRALVPELAARYAELSGGSTSDATALADAVTSAFERVSAGAGVGSGVDLAFRPNDTGLHVDLSCNGHRESLTVKIAVGQS